MRSTHITGDKCDMDDAHETDGADDDVERWDLDDDEAIYPCPFCGESIHEDAERCPHCEQYITSEDDPPLAKPWWMIVGVMICLYIVYRWTTGR